MTEEVKVEETKECKCFCRSEGVKKFVIVALGTFVGFYAAMSLFVATHRPPCYMMKGHYMRPAIEHRLDFRGPHRHFRGQFPVRPGEKAPFEAPKPAAAN